MRSPPMQRHEENLALNNSSNGDNSSGDGGAYGGR